MKPINYWRLLITLLVVAQLALSIWTLLRLDELEMDLLSVSTEVQK